MPGLCCSKLLGSDLVQVIRKDSVQEKVENEEEHGAEDFIANDEVRHSVGLFLLLASSPTDNFAKTHTMKALLKENRFRIPKAR
jgi:hypothetical protein